MIGQGQVGATGQCGLLDRQRLRGEVGGCGQHTHTRTHWQTDWLYVIMYSPSVILSAVCTVGHSISLHFNSSAAFFISITASSQQHPVGIDVFLCSQTPLCQRFDLQWMLLLSACELKQIERSKNILWRIILIDCAEIAEKVFSTCDKCCALWTLREVLPPSLCPQQLQ